ncbi:DUF4249 domain-containing protein [Salinimicrobium sp. CDJ15-81-2]|nr:DUF4249 domain-containing protein [Salinimicrobium nanhaiense]
MNFKKLFKIFLLPAAFIVVHSCVEPYDFETQTFEDALVVEAMITDEIKFQEINLSRTYRLEEDFPSAESFADVLVTDDRGNEFYFYEMAPGKYISHVEFGAQSQRQYQLFIQTQDGGSYSSDPTELLPGSEIEDLFATRVVFQGEDGIALLVDNENMNEASDYSLYEYEETYKIVSPIVVRNTIAFEGDSWQVVPNTKQETICFSTDPSKEIIISSTSDLNDNNLDSFLVRFIKKDDPVLSHRYSLLVKKYSLTGEAYSYYSTLKKISGSESLLSQNQPGFVNGNLFSVNNEDEKVIGFFTLSDVSTKRVFFSYYDFFEFSEPRPMFQENCMIFRPGQEIITPLDMIQTGSVRYVGMAGPPLEGEAGEGPMRVVATECVDCTFYGTNETPDFWEE